MRSYDFTEARQFARSGRSTPVGDSVIFWSERGEPDGGETLVFLHGIPSWSYLWRNVIEITGVSHRSIALDLPGFGLSDKSARHSFHVSALASTVEAFLDSVVQYETQLTLVVHDFGALVGTELVRRNPDRYRNLIITNTSMRESSWRGGGPLRILGLPVLGHLAMSLSRPWMLRLAMRPFVGDPSARTPERVAGYWYPFEAGFGSSLARLYREGAFEDGDFQRWRESLRSFDGSTLIAWGTRDPAFTQREIEDLLVLLPHAAVTHFGSASHFLPEERPRALGRLILSFLAGNLTSEAATR